MSVTSFRFTRWAQEYEELVGALSRDTWQAGILREVTRLGISDGRILDIGAGSGIGGRLLKTLGPFHITALDLSSEMLNLASGIYDEMVQADFSSFDIPGADFMLAVSGFDSLNYLAEPQLGSFFKSVSKVLAPNGHLIFDYSSPKLLWQEWAEKSYEQRLLNATLHWHHHYNPYTKGSEISLTLFDSDHHELWQEHHVQYTHDCFQMHTLAQNAGLTIERVRNLDNEFFSPAQNTHVYVIRKHRK